MLTCFRHFWSESGVQVYHARWPPLSELWLECRGNLWIVNISICLESGNTVKQLCALYVLYIHLYNNNNNNNNKSICKAHNVSIRAESESIVYLPLYDRMKKALPTLCAGYSKAEPKSQNLISWRWSLPLPTDPVEDPCMGTQFWVIVVTDPQTQKQTWLITIHCAAD